jgi:hypothetical protein
LCALHRNEARTTTRVFGAPGTRTGATFMRRREQVQGHACGGPDTAALTLRADTPRPNPRAPKTDLAFHNVYSSLGQGCRRRLARRRADALPRAPACPRARFRATVISSRE